MPFYLRGDSGFASPDFYAVLEDKNCKYAIRLKENIKPREMVEEEKQTLFRATKFNHVDYAVEYGEFMYRAGSWSRPHRVVYKIEKLYGADDPSLPLYCNNIGNGIILGHPVLLRQRQDGKLHQRCIPVK